MALRQHLAPVSFHLRDFNKYTTLDLDAATNGNLTLIGENATGKTTLANCFFPMLIDGSIATPSFNPAKGTERLELAGNPRNSVRDTRNFEGMLLGWGSGSMKVRTGYSYMVLRSTTRQVILGIGAYRNVGEVRKPTWWFVVIGDHESDLQLVTTDNNGHGLGKEEFVATNQAIADQLTVFDQATEYREYVATRVYGFTSGEELGKLASAYRLLASPILTAGNARFTPIREALKNAQDGIDPQVIGEIADSQREVNQLAVLVKRIQRGVTRLKKMKKEIFWRNLNHLNEITLSHYSETRVEYDQNQSKQNDISLKYS